MAEVSADNVSLNYNGTELFLSLYQTTVYDAGGNNNGHLDPGETADITATLKNIGGIAFNDLATTLTTADPYVTIMDNTGYFGFLAVDSIKENQADPYTVEVSALAPQGHSIEFTLIAEDGAFSDTFSFACVIGTYHYLVWNSDPTPAPGQAIHNILTSMGYSGIYSTTLPATDLDMYLAIFVCVGIYPNNYVILANSAEANALVNYCNSGGRLYLEGGDVWYYDPLIGGHNFCSLFGILASADGTTDMGPIAGNASAFTNGMYFAYGGENSFMDHIDPTDAGFLIFTDVDNSYSCGVASDAETYRTVGTSFELGNLIDGTGVSTRAALLDSILHFFGIALTGVAENTKGSSAKYSMRISPNPGKSVVRIELNLGPQAENAMIGIYDATGRLVKSFALSPLSAIPYGGSAPSILWNSTDNMGRRLPPGIYFIKLNSDNYQATEKLILVR